jgi:hypothetical protein
MPNKYSVYSGEFPCHTCKSVSKNLRFYSDTKIATWLCDQNHLTSVSFDPKKKTKKDYERKV